MKLLIFIAVICACLFTTEVCAGKIRTVPRTGGSGGAGSIPPTPIHDNHFHSSSNYYSGSGSYTRYEIIHIPTVNSFFSGKDTLQRNQSEDTGQLKGKGPSDANKQSEYSERTDTMNNDTASTSSFETISSVTDTTSDSIIPSNEPSESANTNYFLEVLLSSANEYFQSDYSTYVEFLESEKKIILPAYPDLTPYCRTVDSLKIVSANPLNIYTFRTENYHTETCNRYFTPRWGRKVFFGVRFNILTHRMAGVAMGGFGMEPGLEIMVRLKKKIGIRLYWGYQKSKSTSIKSNFEWDIMTENGSIDTMTNIPGSYSSTAYNLIGDVWFAIAGGTLGELYTFIGGGTCIIRETTTGFNLEKTGIDMEGRITRTSTGFKQRCAQLSAGFGLNTPMKNRIVGIGFEFRYSMIINRNAKELLTLGDNAPVTNNFNFGIRLIL